MTSYQCSLHTGIYLENLKLKHFTSHIHVYIYKQDLAQYDVNKMCTLNFQVFIVTGYIVKKEKRNL